MTLLELWQSTKKYKEWRGVGYGQNQSWKLMNIIPFRGTKTLLVQMQCFGETEKSEHIINLQFQGLKFVEEIPKNAEYETLDYKDQEYYFEHPTIDTEVKVRCSCSDYTYRFSYANWKAKCQFGSKPKAYKKKTNRKPLNPDLIPGLCKHISQAQSYLKQEGIMK